MNSTADNRSIELHKQVAALQLQNDALRQQLAAAQAEARGLRAENERLREALIEIKALGDTGGWANQMKVVAEKALAAGGGA